MGNSKSYNVLFNISKKDLAASKLLYENGHYPQAVFSLQQSIEKAVKSLAVFADEVKNPSKEIGHNCANYYKLTNDKYKEKIDRLKNDEETTEVLCRLMGFDNDNLTEGLQELKDGTEELEGTLDSAIKKPYKYRFMTNADIAHIISKLEEVESEYNLSILDEATFFSSDEEFELYKADMVNKFMNISEFLINKYQEEGRYLVENAYELVEAEMDSFGGVDKDSWNKVIYSITQVNYVYKTLYLLSLITDSHAVSSRYPMNEFNPIEFYTPNLPMIENFGFLINTAEKVIDSISSVYEEYAKNVEFQNEQGYHQK